MGKQKSKQAAKTSSSNTGKPISSYKAGDVNKRGRRIERIYASGEHFVIYKTENNRTSFETHNLPSRLQPAVNEYKRLASEVSTYFKGNFSQEITDLLVAALTSALRSKEDEDPAAYFKVAHEFIREKGKVKTVYGHSPEFIVWQDTNNNLKWSYLNMTNTLQKIVLEFEELQGLVHTTLPDNHYNQINSLMGFSLVAAFRSPAKKSMAQHFDSIREYIEKRSTAYARAKFLIYSFSASIGMTIILLVIYSAVGVDAVIARNIILGAVGGILGTSVSIVHRNKLIVVDPFVPPVNLIFLGFVRVFLGMVFGSIIIIMSKANMFLGLLQDNMYALFVVSVMAGFAERIVPDIWEIFALSSSKEKL